MTKTMDLQELEQIPRSFLLRILNLKLWSFLIFSIVALDSMYLMVSVENVTLAKLFRKVTVDLYLGQVAGRFLHSKISQINKNTIQQTFLQLEKNERTSQIGTHIVLLQWFKTVLFHFESNSRINCVCEMRDSESESESENVSVSVNESKSENRMRVKGRV